MQFLTTLNLSLDKLLLNKWKMLGYRRKVKYWDKGIVPVYLGFERTANQNKTSFINKAVQEIHNKTCVK
jgi:hypothetical protein